MRVEPFLMERWQSVHEHEVSANLSESGVHPLSLGELLALPGDDELDAAALAQTGLGYPQTNGTRALRERITGLYPGAGVENVLVTHGGAEANLLSALRHCDRGDEVVVLLPNYMQLPGLAESLGARVRPWRLTAENGWTADVAELEELVGERTRLIVITTPNNPTGRILPAETLDAVARIAERVGAWVLSDEIYRGAELDGAEAPSMWGRYERLLVTSGLSKAYGLPGLRTGWIACPLAGEVEELWSAKDYTSIASSPLTQTLATLALEPIRRRAILERTRGILARNLPALETWLAERGDAVTGLAPEAGAILWMSYSAPIGSTALAERLLAERDVLVVPGDYFGTSGHLRLGYGGEPAELTAGLTALGRFLDEVGTGAA